MPGALNKYTQQLAIAEDKYRAVNAKYKAKLAQANYVSGAFEGLDKMPGFPELNEAFEQTVVRAARRQRYLIRNFVTKTEAKYGEMRKPKADIRHMGDLQPLPKADFTGTTSITSGARALAWDWPGILYDRKQDQVIQSMRIVETDVEVNNRESLLFILDVWLQCMLAAHNIPSNKDRTYFHEQSFYVGIWRASDRMIHLLKSGYEITAESLVIEPGDRPCIINTAYYASSLENYFNFIGKTGIMYSVFQQTQNKAKAHDLEVRYSYIYPDKVTPRTPTKASSRTVRGRVQTYEYNLPVMYFGALGSFLGEVNSQPGMKLGKGGRLGKNTRSRIRGYTGR